MSTMRPGGPLANRSEVRDTNDRSRRRELLLHPVFVLAVFALLFNDHWWKGRGPDVVTGKLSDLAGAIVLTAIGVRLVERTGRSKPVAVGAAVVVVGGLAKLSTTGATVAGWIAGATRWPIDVVQARSVVGLTPGTIVVDPTDLLPIVAGVAVALVVGAGDRALVSRPGHPGSPPKRRPSGVTAPVG